MHCHLMSNLIIIVGCVGMLLLLDRVRLVICSRQTLFEFERQEKEGRFIL
jgi:hypothetical protein